MFMENNIIERYHNILQYRYPHTYGTIMGNTIPESISNYTTLMELFNCDIFVYITIEQCIFIKL